MVWIGFNDFCCWIDCVHEAFEIKLQWVFGKSVGIFSVKLWLVKLCTVLLVLICCDCEIIFVNVINLLDLLDCIMLIGSYELGLLD